MKKLAWLLTAIKTAKVAAPHVKRLYDEDKKRYFGWRGKLKAAKKYTAFVYQRGVCKGIQQGQRQERERIARSMLKMACDPKLISKATGLSKREIERLR